MTDITAEVIADSVGPGDTCITTFKLRYPRFIHSEFMTHRMFSRNASSSRAIPVQKEVDKVFDNPALPIHVGKNQKGMQAYEEIPEDDKSIVLDRLSGLGKKVAGEIQYLNEAYGVHKQVLNRYLEPWQHIDVLVTATEWSNFFKLRDHEAAEPHIRLLAQRMKEARENSLVTYYFSEEMVGHFWHTPFWTEELVEYDSTDQLLICVARCARVSYRNHNGESDPEADIRLAKQLYRNGHWSPFEHIANSAFPETYYANLRGWRSLRNLIEAGVYSVKEEEKGKD